MAFNLSNPKNQKKVAAVLFGIIFLYLAYTFLIAPQSSQIASLKNEKSGLQKEINTLIRKKKQIPELKEELERKSNQINIIKEYLPNKPNYDKLITDLSTILKNSNLKVSSINFGDIKKKKDFSQLKIEINLKGTFHNIGYFFSSLSKMSRIITVDNFSFSKFDDEEDNFTIEANIDLFSYIKK